MAKFSFPPPLLSFRPTLFGPLTQENDAPTALSRCPYHMIKTLFFFVFCFFCLVIVVVCSEESCRYRYQFDNLIELTATWDAADGNGVEGQVSVTQVSEDEEEGLAVLQISVFLTAASRRERPMLSSKIRAVPPYHTYNNMLSY